MEPSLGLLILAASASAIIIRYHEVDHVSDTEWHLWKAEHGKNYPRLGDERERYAVWQDNVRRIEEHNKQESPSYTLKINHFGDLTSDEFQRNMNGYTKASNKTTGSAFLRRNGLAIPTEIDWRKEGYVTPVKNQEQCGSCWAFSTTGTLEGQWFKERGQLVSLSEQHLIDCVSDNSACNGGSMDIAFAYIKNNYGIDKESEYPYDGFENYCRCDEEHVGAQVVGYTDIPTGDEEALTEAIASIGPISIAIDASRFSFQFYHDGVYDELLCSSEELDHAALVVGYGVSIVNKQEKPYYLVKNSYGEKWGNLGGYIRMSRNKNNQCGIATYASYPLVPNK